MKTGRQRFLDRADAAYARLKRRRWSDLKVGDWIRVRMNGSLADVVTVEWRSMGWIVDGAGGRDGQFFVTESQFVTVLRSR